MGRAYAEGRNHDLGPGRRDSVSGLSPYLRHRLLLESEAIGSALAAHGTEAAGRFIEEVFWRSYWKGWLEQRPAVWTEYRAGVAAALAGPQAAPAAEAAAGRSGIACLDAWARELAEMGTLHNHARMWFASIWVFTLGLPWELGADFFLRHLLDGDAASNTLSWRWVIGSHTPGKHYVARAENIARFTAGRFDPAGVLEEAPAPILLATPPAVALPAMAPPPDGPVALLLHEDDLHPESLGLAGVAAVGGFAVPEARSPSGCAPAAAGFTRAALADALGRAGRHFAAPAVALAPTEVVAWATATGCRTLVTPHAPVGWVAEVLAALDAPLAARGIRLHRLRRPWDAACWPLATRGFFPFRRTIPALLDRLRPATPIAA